MPSRRCNNHDWVRTADRPPASWKLRHIHVVDDLTLPACRWTARLYKHFIYLRKSSKRVTARFATWNPANWHENQIEIRSKTLLIPKHCAVWQTSTRGGDCPLCRRQRSTFHRPIASPPSAIVPSTSLSLDCGTACRLTSLYRRHFPSSGNHWQSYRLNIHWIATCDFLAWHSHISNFLVIVKCSRSITCFMSQIVVKLRLSTVTAWKENYRFIIMRWECMHRF